MSNAASTARSMCCCSPCFPRCHREAGLSLFLSSLLTDSRLPPPPPSNPFEQKVYFVHEMSLMVWKERVFEALKERLRNNTIRVINAARERNLSDLDDNEAVKCLLQT